MDRKGLLVPLAFALACFAAAPVGQVMAATDGSANAGKHDTAKGAAAGALVGHEVGHGHAMAGAATGAAIGHHEKTKARKEAGSNG